MPVKPAVTRCDSLFTTIAPMPSRDRPSLTLITTRVSWRAGSAAKVMSGCLSHPADKQGLVKQDQEDSARRRYAQACVTGNGAEGRTLVHHSLAPRAAQCSAESCETASVVSVHAWSRPRRRDGSGVPGHALSRQATAHNCPLSNWSLPLFPNPRVLASLSSPSPCALPSLVGDVHLPTSSVPSSA
jgi:hypothetical protein